MSWSSWRTKRKVYKGVKASACGTTRGMMATASMPFERICGYETGMRGNVCAVGREDDEDESGGAARGPRGAVFRRSRGSL